MCGLHTSKVVFNMPHARYKVKCSLCKKTFDNDNSGASLQEVPSKLHTEDSIIVQYYVNMNNGDLRGAKGTMATGQTIFVAEKGPALGKTFKLNHRKRLSAPCAFYLCLQGRIKPWM